MKWKTALMIPVMATFLACGGQRHVEPEEKGKASISTIAIDELVNIPRAKLLSVTDGYAGYTFAHEEGEDATYSFSPFRHYQMPTFLIGKEKVSLLIPKAEPLVPNSIYELDYRKLLPNSKLTVEKFVRVYVDRSFDTLDNYELSNKLVGIIDNIKPIM